MEIIGREIEFGLATEASRGSADTTADKWARKVTADIIERATHADDDTTRGKLEDGEGRRKVSSFIEGELSGALHIDMLGWLLSNIYGVVVTSTVTGSVKSHAFSLKQSIQHTSLTLFAKDGSVQQYAFSNGMVRSLEISAAMDDLLRFKCEFEASAASVNSDTPHYDTEYDFVPRDVVVKVADTEAGLSGATALKTKDLSIKWNPGIVRDHVHGSYTADDIYNTGMKITGSFTKNFDDKTFKDLYLGNTAKYMSIVITGEADIGSGNFPTITIILNKVQITDWKRSGGANDLVTETIEFRAYMNAADAEQSTTTLKNLTSSYVNVPSA